jgi:hypothetical protein
MPKLDPLKAGPRPSLFLLLRFPRSQAPGTPELGTVHTTAAFDRLAAKKVKPMRILTLCIVGLTLMTAGCASRPATTTAPAAPAQSGAAATPMASGAAGDSIDQWAAVVERQRGMRR